MLSLITSEDKENSVFGMDKGYWFIPAYSEEDIRRMPVLQGLEYPSTPGFSAQEF
uniref:S-acyltransferase At3g60800 family n=1 Tax=Cajanus cajan TaxID=3821 RepID=A0A151RIQ7_CAJCA|nr:putative S-acyltransferase At3g60800 family [Cajanus cajan]